MRPTTERAYQLYVESLTREAYDEFDLAELESPIEEEMYRGLRAARCRALPIMGGAAWWDGRRLRGGPDEDLSFGLAHFNVDLVPLLSSYRAAVVPQVAVSKYRADFLIGTCRLNDHGDRWVYDERWLAVECDGHAFHEKTADQAERDKRRDRDFLAEGLHVARFTGREIRRDPLACARSAWSLLRQATVRSFEFTCSGAFTRWSSEQIGEKDAA